MKRFLTGLAVAAGILVAASPALAADTYHYRSIGSGAQADWSNIPPDAKELPAGHYFETWVLAGNRVEGDVSVQDTMGNGLCVNYWTFTVDANGNWSDEQNVSACDTAAVLTLDPRLRSDHLVGTLPVQECTAWDDQTGDCIGEWVLLGTFGIDVTLTGTGATTHSHGTDSGGTAGSSQFTMHGTSQERAAIATGSVTYNGDSITGGATQRMASLWSSKNGYTEVIICHKDSGC